MAQSRPIRAAVLGAFPFPYPQGSQVYVGDHSRALSEVGIEPTLFAYGRGVGNVPEGLRLVSTPLRWSPGKLRSGPGLAKFPADAALLGTYVAAHRRQPFDVALAHNAEAACVALAARALIGVPVVYVVHTIMQFELSSYAAPRWGPVIDNIGERLDRFVARRADGILALSQDAIDILAPYSRGPISLVPPGLDPDPAPSHEEIEAACARHRIVSGRFCLYGGNLDGYQDLALLRDAARRLEQIESDQPLEIVVATHDGSNVPHDLIGLANLRCIEVEDYQQMRCLAYAAQSTVLCRRRRGGFPIKLLNYMEAGKPIVAFERVATGFAHLRNAWLLSPEADGIQMADALASLARDPELAARLGKAARNHLESAHNWSDLAARTRLLVEETFRRIP